MILFNSSFYIAQAYGCGAYSQSTYSQCAATPQDSTTSTIQNAQSSSTATTQSSATDQSQLQQTATPEQSKDFLGPAETSAGAKNTPQETGPMAGVGFDLILLLSLGLAVLIAILLLLIRRLRRHHALDHFTTFPPSTPPQS